MQLDSAQWRGQGVLVRSRRMSPWSTSKNSFILSVEEFFYHGSIELGYIFTYPQAAENLSGEE